MPVALQQLWFLKYYYNTVAYNAINVITSCYLMWSIYDLRHILEYWCWLTNCQVQYYVFQLLITETPHCPKQYYDFQLFITTSGNTSFPITMERGGANRGNWSPYIQVLMYDNTIPLVYMGSQSGARQGLLFRLTRCPDHEHTWPLGVAQCDDL